MGVIGQKLVSRLFYFMLGILVKQKAKMAEEIRKAQKMKAHRERKLENEQVAENQIHDQPEKKEAPISENLIAETREQIHIHHIQQDRFEQQASVRIHI